MRLRCAGLLLVVVAAAGACVPQPAGRATAGPLSTAPEPATPVAPATPSGPTPSPTFRRPTPTPQPTFLAYRVRTGDTLTSIAREFGTTTESISYWNRVTYPSLDPDSPTYRPNDIRVGWTLLVVPNDVVDPENLPPGGPTPEPQESDESPEPEESDEVQ